MGNISRTSIDTVWHRWPDKMLTSMLFTILCLQLSAAITSIDIMCPRECVCTSVKRNAIDHLDITCFVWNIEEFNFRSLSRISEPFTLKLKCDSGISSKLNESMFSHLHTMQALSFHNCKVSYVHSNVFRGLTNLLEVELHGASNHHLPIHPSAFKDPLNIETLVFVNNKLSKMPSLCNLHKLKVVNISRNDLTEFKDTGLICEREKLDHISLIDISNNNIKSVSDLKVHSKAFPNLTTFIASANQISLKPDDKPFVNFLALRILDLRQNSISNLPPTLIELNRDLQSINLSDNEILHFPSQFFMHSKFLLHADLQRNGLDDTVWSRLINQGNLMYLDLSYNKINTLNQTAISELTSLVHLNLDYNNILSIPPRTFQNQQRLHELKLAGNQFHTIDKYAFYGLMYLTKLELQNNNIYSMNSAVLDSLTSLTYLNVSSNFLTDFPSLLKLSSLLGLDMSNNAIGTLPVDAFIALTKIRDINLSNNQIDYLDDSVFNACNALETLDLSENNIQYIHPAMLMELKVTKLWLQYNRIENIGRTFASMKLLQELNLSNNYISDTIQRNSFPASLEMLDLSYNKISHIRPRAFDGLDQIRMIDLQYNRISTLTSSALAVSTGLYAQTGFLINENPLICDCNLLWLKKWDQSTRGPIIANLNRTRCSGAYDYPESVVQMIPEDRFLCPYNNTCPSSCRCCDYIACDCKYTCPKQCNCYRSSDYSSIHLVVCSGRNLTFIDRFMPRLATSVDYSANNLQRIPSHAFLGMSKLLSLHFSRSNIQQIQNRSFTGLLNAKYLHLDHNRITELRKGMFYGLTALEELYLDHNQISVIKDGAFDHMSSLKTLRLSNNYLQRLDSYTSQLLRLSDLTLFANPWSCDCVLYFSTKLNPLAFSGVTDEMSMTRISCNVQSIDEKNKLIAIDEYRGICEDNELTLQTYIDPAPSDEWDTPVENIDSHGNGSSSDASVTLRTTAASFLESNLHIVVPVIIGSTLILILAITIACRGEFVRCWLCTKYQCSSRERQLMYDKSRHYDAFIVYHRRDEIYVTRDLALKLERGKVKYHLLVQHRDRPASSSMPHFIENGVQSSHRTILILSSDHLSDSRWLRYATECVAHDSINRLVLITLGKIDKSALDPVLKSRMNTDHCISYGDSWFWDKLNYCLPEPGKVEKNAIRAEAHPYASTDLAKLSSAMMDNQAYEDPPSLSTRPLPSIVEYVSPPSVTYDYAGGSQQSSNIYEEIADENTSAHRYEEPWRDIDLRMDLDTFSRQTM